MGLKKCKVFYGWWIVGAGFLLSAYTAGVITYGFTAIFEPLAKEFSWSYAQISVAASIRGLETSFLAPILGLGVDRWGPRKLVFAGVAICGLGLFLLSHVTSLGTFYLVFILIALGTSTCSGGVVLTAVVGSWFRKRMATATGVLGSGVGMGGLFVPVVTLLVDRFGWRVAMAIFGLGAWIILLPLSFFLRHKPEQYGYLPDGDVSKQVVVSEGQTSAKSTEVEIGVKQAIKNRVFWQIALGLMCHVLVINAVVTHIMPYLSSIGIPRITSSLVASAIPLTSVCGRLTFGWLGDRFDKRWGTGLGFALTSLGMLSLIYIANIGIWMLIPFLILFGNGYGAPIPMAYALVREHFGRVKFGSILGLIMGVAMMGNIVGAPLAGWVFENFGSYHGAWLAYAVLVAGGIVFFITLPSVGNTIQVASKLRE